MTGEDIDRYVKAQHALHTGVEIALTVSSQFGQMKQFRAEFVTLTSDVSALVKLLIKKGVITLDEYDKAAADEIEADVKEFQETLRLFGCVTELR